MYLFTLKNSTITTRRGYPEHCIGTTEGYRFLTITIKGQAIPVQAWRGPEVCRRL